MEKYDVLSLDLHGKHLTNQMKELGVPFSRSALLNYRKMLDARVDWTSENQKRVAVGRVTKLLSSLNEDGRIYPDWEWDAAKAGFWSCKNPSLTGLPHQVLLCMQNVDVVNIHSFNYIVACTLAEEQWVLDLYQEGKDIHEFVAKKIRRTKEEAKMFLYSNMFGASIEGTAERLNMREDTAQRALEGWWEIHPQLRKLKNWVHAFAEKNDNVVTGILGKTIEIEHDPKFPQKFENAAFANFISGTAADILKVSFIKLWDSGTPVFSILPDEIVVARGMAWKVLDVLNSVGKFRLRTSFYTL